MEDGAKEAESILHPMQQNPEEEEVSDDKRSGGLIDHIFSNLVTKRETDEDKEEKKQVEEIKRDEKGGGILDQIISTLVSPKAEKYKEESVFHVRNGGESEEHDKEKQKETLKVERENEVTESNGSIIENIVSHFPKSLPYNAEPTTDEASILIHSIIHD